MSIHARLATDKFIDAANPWLESAVASPVRCDEGEPENVWADVMDAVYAEQDACRTLYQQTRYPRPRRSRRPVARRDHWAGITLAGFAVAAGLLIAIAASADGLTTLTESWIGGDDAVVVNYRPQVRTPVPPGPVVRPEEDQDSISEPETLPDVTPAPSRSWGDSIQSQPMGVVPFSALKANGK
jgi:hypothetical protein